MSSTNDAKSKRIANVERLAKKAFANHRVEQLLDAGSYQGWRCSAPGDSAYWFDVITGPGWLLVRGDIGEMHWQRTTDMIAWSRSAINSIDYFAEKVPRGIAAEEYDSDRVQEWISEWRAEHCDDTQVVEEDRRTG